MSQPEFDPFDPINAAMRAMHQGNMLAAAEARCENQAKTIAEMRYAGDELARVIVLRKELSELPAVEAMETLVRNLQKTKSNAELLLRGLR